MDEDEVLSNRIKATRQSGIAVETELATDGQIIARVTDGIYHRPAAAFRELISNAYDADATTVTIHTDRPRFRRITVTDDGHGMDPEAVAHLINHIGGSTKRTERGVNLGVTGPNNPDESPGGRRLIGKIGIGLFSVSQLTQSFQIVTKIKGERWRTVADVRLRQYSTDRNPETLDQLEAGLVSIWQEPADDLESHGTTIVLSGLKTAARTSLRSGNTWLRVRRGLQQPPRFHVGAVDANRETEFATEASPVLPWLQTDTPAQAFAKLTSAVSRFDPSQRANAKTSDLLDEYLQTVWELGLSIPTSYISEHPFDDVLDEVRPYELTGTRPDGLQDLDGTQSIADQLGWPKGIGVADDFNVYFDDLKISRPFMFNNFPSTSNALTEPLAFFGHCVDDFGDRDLAVTGGRLEFYAYLLWVPKLVPFDSVGALIRIHKASGTGVDETFLHYQIAETTRLRQIRVEIFVVEGLESALNIDRESFNYAHPHVVRLTSWLHNALGRSIAEQKRLGNQVRREQRAAAARDTDNLYAETVEAFWQAARKFDADSPIPNVRWIESDAESLAAADEVLLTRQQVLGAPRRSAKSRRLEAQLESVARLLSGYDLLRDLTLEQRDNLFEHLAHILRVDE